jgi:hypothetical protein
MNDTDRRIVIYVISKHEARNFLRLPRSTAHREDGDPGRRGDGRKKEVSQGALAKAIL